MKFTLSLLVVLVVALVVPFLLPEVGKPVGVDHNANLPWQIVVDGQGGSTVFGLQPGQSTLAEAKRQFGSDVQVAVIAAPGELGSLEAYFAQVHLGFVLGRVIVTLETDAARLTAMRERALKAEHMESATRKITLHPDDRTAADALPIRAISVIPAVNLDEVTVIQRFGPPGERLTVSEKRVHLLYPEKGLDVIVDPNGKELLQYVAPRHFSLLRTPLQMALDDRADGQ